MLGRWAAARVVALVRGAATRALLDGLPDLRGDDPDRDARAVAHGICQACVRGLDVDGASMSLLTTSEARETLWASDPTADLLEELQFSLNEGACIQAATDGAPVLVPDLHDSADTSRWPTFAAAVLEHTRARALFALPLQWGASNLGVLDLYRGRVGGLGRDQWADAVNVAELGSMLMLGIHTAPDQHPADDRGAGSATSWLDPFQGNHYQVHQATGMVLAQLGVGATEALARMRAYAYAHNRLLTEVARDVINRQLRFTDTIGDDGHTG